MGMMKSAAQSNTLTIGQVAQHAGVNRETLRYYEREGLIDLPNRRESGYRAYSPEVVRQVRFIKRAQELGFSLTEIKELLALTLNNPEDCQEVKKMTEQKVADIESKLRDLERMRKQLLILFNACNGQKPMEECLILKAFSD